MSLNPLQLPGDLKCMVPISPSSSMCADVYISHRGLFKHLFSLSATRTHPSCLLSTVSTECMATSLLHAHNGWVKHKVNSLWKTPAALIGAPLNEGHFSVPKVSEVKRTILPYMSTGRQQISQMCMRGSCTARPNKFIFWSQRRLPPAHTTFTCS